MKRIASLLCLALLLGLLLVPAAADDTLGYVTDAAGLLTSEEAATLSRSAEGISEQYGCGVYIVTVDRFQNYEDVSVIYDFATTIFNRYGMGLGTDRNGVLLVLSMDERDYSLIAHGDIGNSAFTDYGKEVLCDRFLPYFANNNWFGGFTAYVNGCGEFLRQEAAGTPVDVAGGSGGGRNIGVRLLIVLLVPALIAAVVCLSMRSKMKTAVEQTDADRYIPDHGIAVQVSTDQFSHVTETRTKINTETRSGGHGGTSVGAGGFSGRSGKF